MTQKEIEKKPWTHVKSDDPYGPPSKYNETSVVCPDCGTRYPGEKELNVKYSTDEEQCPRCDVVLSRIQ